MCEIKYISNMSTVEHLPKINYWVECMICSERQRIYYSLVLNSGKIKGEKLKLIGWSRPGICNEMVTKTQCVNDL